MPLEGVAVLAALAWGVALGSWGLGGVAGAAAVTRLRESRRPLIIGILGTAGYALAPASFALRLPLPTVFVAISTVTSGPERGLVCR